MFTARHLSTALVLGVTALSAASLAVPALVATASGERSATADAAGGHAHTALSPAALHISHHGIETLAFPSQLSIAGTNGRTAISTTGPDTVTTSTMDAAATATFQVTYVGFTPEARADFQRAVDIWSHLISSPVPITVYAQYEPLAESIEGYAGASHYRTDFPGAKQPHTFYPEPLANKMAGHQIDESPDIEAHFNSGAAHMHFGTGPISLDQEDFASIVLHEIGHGLGFVGAAAVEGGRATMGTPGYPLAFDRYTRAADGRSLLDIADPADLATQLQSGTVYFDSPAVRIAGGGRPAQLYAPAPWGGSSYSHLDESTYPEGDPNELMTPVLQRGHVVPGPGPLTLAILRTIGW